MLKRTQQAIAYFFSPGHNQDGPAKLFHYAILGLISICLFSRLFVYLSPKDLWLDEAALWATLKDLNFRTLLKGQLGTQAAPIMFVIINKIIIKYLGQSLLYLRFLPCLASVLSVFLMYKLCKKFSIYYAFFSLLILSLCITPIYYAGEFKQYPIEFFVNLIIVYVSLQNYKNITGDKCLIFSNKNLIIYIICGMMSTAGLLTIAGVLIAQFIYGIYIYIYRKNSLCKIHLCTVW